MTIPLTIRALIPFLKNIEDDFKMDIQCELSDKSAKLKWYYLKGKPYSSPTIIGRLVINAGDRDTVVYFYDPSNLKDDPEYEMMCMTDDGKVINYTIDTFISEFIG